VPPKKKKKKSEKKRKNKKKHKKSGRHSDSSGSDSGIIFPSDLKRQRKADRYRRTLLHCYPLDLIDDSDGLLLFFGHGLASVVMQSEGCSASKLFLLVG